MPSLTLILYLLYFYFNFGPRRAGACWALAGPGHVALAGPGRVALAGPGRVWPSPGQGVFTTISREGKRIKMAGYEIMS